MTGYHHVRSYHRSDGTPVRGHTRRNPTRAGGAGGLIVLLLLAVLAHGGLSHQPHAHAARPATQTHQAARSHRHGTRHAHRPHGHRTGRTGAVHPGPTPPSRLPA